MKKTDTIMNTSHIQENKTYKFNKTLIISVIIIASILQISLIFNNNIWSDEAFTMSAVRQNWKDMWEILINDVHPPLYYIILKLVISLTSDSLIVARLVSIFPIILNSIIISALTLKDKERKENKLTGILLAMYIIATNLTTNFLHMSIEIRMYTWAILFVTLSGIYAYKVYKDTSKKNITIFILLSLGAALTHYFALVAEIIIYIALYITLFIKEKKNLKTILRITLITVIGYAWWIPFAIKQITSVKSEFWMTSENCNLINLITTIFNLDIRYTIVVLAVILGFSVYKLFIKKNLQAKEKQEIIYGTLNILTPITIIIIGLLLNQIIRPIFYQRYIIPSLGLFWLGIIIIISHIDYKKISILVASFIIIIMVSMSYPKKYIEEYKTNTDSTINFINSVIEPEDIITTNITQLTQYVLDYYFPNNKTTSISNINLEKETKTIWYLEHIEQKIEKEAIKENGYELEKVYTGEIGLEYKFDIYKMKKY